MVLATVMSWSVFVWAVVLILLALRDVIRGQLGQKPQQAEAARPGTDGRGGARHFYLVPIRRDGRHPSSVRIHDSRNARPWDVRNGQEQKAWQR